MFIHLHTHSPFSFLDGASSIESLVAAAAMNHMPALALTDHHTIAGLPAFHRWAAAYGIKPISGAEVALEDGSHLTLLAETPVGYENLCRILTAAHAGVDRRRDPRVAESVLLAHAPGLIVFSGCRRGRLAQLLLRQRSAAAQKLVERYQAAFPGAYFLELQADEFPDTRRLNRLLAQLGAACHVPLIATGNVHYASPERFPVHDILSCLRVRCDIHTAHPERPLNQARWLFDTATAERRFREWPEALLNTVRVARRCQVVLRLDGALFPVFQVPDREGDAATFLRKLVRQGAAERYPQVDDALRQRLHHELEIIIRLGYADYFLVVWDIVRFARRRGIRAAGRGSAADSAVAYCLYITDVDAAGRGLLFERFMSLERAEKPDIDIDFDSRRRDEVMAYVYRLYGRDHVARVATWQTFRGRSAIREVGGALGLPASLLDTLAKRVPWSAHADKLAGLFDRVPELADLASWRDRLPWLWQLSAAIAGFPRHFGMHVGGMVISRRPLLETTSLQPSAKGEWMTPFDKDAVEDVGLVKLDLLSLRTMGAIDDAIRLRAGRGERIDYDRIPLEDEDTFRMLGTGNTIGVFQLESPAQRALQAKLRPEGLEDIVASVALIRPGPIKGNMVDPFLARRRGEEPISYLHPKLEPILGKTYGVVLFQEQVIEIATAIAQFTPGEADQLRRVMSHARSAEDMEKIGRQFLQKASLAGVEPEVAGTIFSYIQGYASYGFCEAHAAAFAVTAYKTAYLAQHYPTEFFAAILNQYPMGYYPIHVICAESRRRGIQVLGPDINSSDWDCLVGSESAGGDFIRLGFRLLRGFRRQVADELQQERTRAGPFSSLLDVLRRVPGLDRLGAENLVRCGALDKVQPLSRRRLLWELPVWMEARHAPASALFAASGISIVEGCASGAVASAEPVNTETLSARLADEYSLLGVGVSGHWLQVLRPHLATQGYLRAIDIDQVADGETVYLAGLLVRPHRPPTKSGRTTVFFTLEDETGFADAAMFESAYHASGGVLFTPLGRLIGVEGRVQRRGGGRAQLMIEAAWSLMRRS